MRSSTWCHNCHSSRYSYLLLLIRKFLIIQSLSTCFLPSICWTFLGFDLWLSDKLSYINLFRLRLLIITVCLLSANFLWVRNWSGSFLYFLTRCNFTSDWLLGQLYNFLWYPSWLVMVLVLLSRNFWSNLLGDFFFSFKILSLSFLPVQARDLRFCFWNTHFRKFEGSIHYAVFELLSDLLLELFELFLNLQIDVARLL